MQQDQTPERKVEGPIKIHFKSPESMKTAEGLPTEPEKLCATVPEGAEIELRPQGISVKHSGRNYDWTLNSVRAVIKNGTQIQQW